MKQCCTCNINSVKVATDKEGNGWCWRCYYINLYGKERGEFIYKSIFKDKVNDEKLS
jgi:hypothetical protein